MIHHLLNHQEAWLYATGSVFLVSSCGLLGILVVPLMENIAYQEILKFLVAMAVGTLGGDALMHLIPHAICTEHDDQSSDDQEHDHKEPVLMCACTFLTAVLMYVLETILPLLMGSDHSHSEVPPIPTSSSENKMNKKPMQPVAFMVILGDSLHNLTDGLAIGAAFASEHVIGLATAFAVLCHELPHELGDFALLLQTGVTVRRAILFHVASSMLSFIGMAVGLLIAGINTNLTRWVYAGTAGAFLYIAFVDLIPVMSREGKKNLKNSVIQIAGILVGGGVMLLIALNEETLEELFE